MNMEVRQQGSMFPPTELFFAEDNPQGQELQNVTFLCKNVT